VEIEFHFLTPFYGFERQPSSPFAYVTELAPYLTHFNPEDGGSMFLVIVGVCLQDYTVSKPVWIDIKSLNTNTWVTSKVMATNFFGQTRYIEESSKYTYERA
jgi:hypothetical protein